LSQEFLADIVQNNKAKKKKQKKILKSCRKVQDLAVYTMLLPTFINLTVSVYDSDDFTV